jgi:hypothetical protein
VNTASDMDDAIEAPTPRSHGRMRGVAVTTLLVVGTLLMVGAGIGIWAQRQALDTDNWVDTSGDLLENQQIRTAVGLYLVDKLYDTDEVQQRLASALPPKLEPLAAPAAVGLKQVAERNAPRLLGNALALQAWRDANRAAHETLLKAIDGADLPVDLNLGVLLEQVAADIGVPPDAVDRLPPDVAQLQIAPPEEIEKVRTAIDVFKAIGWVLFGLAVVAFAAAIFLAPDRRRTTLSAGVCLILAGIAMLAVRKLAGDWVVNALADAPNAHAIADDAWSIGTSLMVSVAEGGMLLGLILVVGAYVAGPGKRAVQTRRLAAPAFAQHPAGARVTLAVLLLLLILWGPVPWTQQAIPLLLLTVAAYVWLEVLMRRTVAEFPPSLGDGPADTAPAPAAI